MAAALEKLCPACRAKHLFFIPNASSPDVSRRNEYTCPTARCPVQMQPSDSDRWQTVGAKPRGAVIVHSRLKK
jgi:hypothetical protein